MRAVIVDDERLARVELRHLLTAHPEIEIVGEAENAAAAVRVVTKHEPALLFLDIQMPGGSGFDVVARLPPPAPFIIFTTAHDAHAVSAFEINALDYLLKPIDPARLASAVARAQVVAGGADVEADAAVGPLGEGDRVFLRAGERLWFIPVADIRLLESVGNSARVVFGTENVLMQRTLNALEARLPASMFFRARRGQIVNLRWIDRVDDWLGDRLRATLRGQGETVEISRRRAAEFRRRCGL